MKRLPLSRFANAPRRQATEATQTSETIPGAAVQVRHALHDLYHGGVARHQGALSSAATTLLNLLPGSKRLEVSRAASPLTVRVGRGEDPELEVRIPRFIYKFQTVDNPVSLKLGLRQTYGVVSPQELAAETKSFLWGESDRTDGRGEFWERLNESLVKHLMQRYPEIGELSSSLRVDSAEAVPGIRTSTIKHTRAPDGPSREEYFSYLMPRHHLPAFPGKSMDYFVDMKYVSPYSAAIDNYYTVHNFVDERVVACASPTEVSAVLAGLPSALKARFPFIEEVSIQLSESPLAPKEGTETAADLRRRLKLDEL